MSVHFLDANIFIEPNIDEYDYGVECDEIFDRGYDRRTSNRVMMEVNRIKNMIIESFDILHKHYLKNTSRFISKNEISRSMMNKIRDIEEWLKGHSGQSKRLLLNTLKQLFITTVQYRKNNISKKLIQESGNTPLYEKISDVMTDEDDAWHVTDAYTWGCDKCDLIFWSMDHDVVDPKEEILNCLCEFASINRSSLPFNIFHIKDIYDI